MFEQITDKRLKDALGVINGLNDYSTETIITSDLNDFIKSFIINDNGKISGRDDLVKAVEKAVKLNLNFCLRPTWTLINYLFGNFDSKQKAEILKRVDIFIYYSYYTETIKEIAHDENYVSIKRPLVESVLQQINSDIYVKLTTDTSSLKLKNIFLQLFKLKYGDNVEVSLDMSIPYSFIKLFFEDKGYTDLIDLFINAGFNNDNEEIELKTIIKVFTGKINNVSEVYKSAEVVETAPAEEVRIPVKDTVIHTPEKTEREEPVNTYSDTSTKDYMFVPQSISSEFEEKEEIPEKHLRFHFKDDEVKSIAKKVYKGNKYLLLDAMLEIEKLKTWREATEYLKEIFINNKVNIGDKSVIMFVDVLNDYFEKR
ncbi:MAG: hypothetical protein WCK13_01380 [Ignavibacteriota bacterium]|nr:hypothetical protein [Ignavibacteriota bacterium]